jgi:pilus assembly protein Flp/PilA
MKAIFIRFMREESAATAIEYGLIASLISVAIIVGATALGTLLNSTLHGISSDIVGAPGG